MRQYFIYLCILFALFSCDSDTDALLSVDDDKCINGETRGGNLPYFVDFDIYGDKYKTFIVTSANNNGGVVVGDRGPFPFYLDGHTAVILADYSYIDLITPLTNLYFDDRGLWPSVYTYDYTLSMYVCRPIPIGEKIAIWASEEEYTNADLRAHDGDEEYFSKACDTFVCCYITTLRKNMVIVYDSVRWFD